MLSIVSCKETNQKKDLSQTDQKYSFDIKSLTDADYPDNPDIGYMASDYNYDYFKKGNIHLERDNTYSFTFFNTQDKSNVLTLKNIDLSEFIPSIPNHLKNNAYLSKIAVINQEWNRNQVRFNQHQFTTSNTAITRVDIARNCLNSYLWEIIVYKKDHGKELPFTHGWFTFPKKLYRTLFEQRNQVSFSNYKKSLENWIDPESKEIDKSYLSKIVDTINISYTDQRNSMYELKGARKKKFKEIIYPTTISAIKSLQNDSTQFATFSPPGFYNKATPRKTELGRLKHLKNISLYTVVSSQTKDTLSEISFAFEDVNNLRTTKLIVGGINLSDLPILSNENANNGWKNSMGFSNHPFYESYSEHTVWHSNENPYYAYLTDQKNKWLDSHFIGIDGPLMYWDDQKSNLLHIWLLSFERHTFVGHYTITI